MEEEGQSVTQRPSDKHWKDDDGPPLSPPSPNPNPNLILPLPWPTASTVNPQRPDRSPPSERLPIIVHHEHT